MSCCDSKNKDNHEHDHDHEINVDISCGCGSCDAPHEHTEKNESYLPFIFRLVAAIILVISVLIVELPFYIECGIFLTAYLLAGYEVLFNAGKNIIKGKLFDENFLMSIASIAAFSIGDMSEAVAVMVFYGLGEFLQDVAVSRSKKNIASLMDIRPDFANLKTVNGVSTISPYEVNIGDIILVRPGEKIPLDGMVTKGESVVDSSMLTGESMPYEINVGDEVFSGSINTNGLIEIKVTKLFTEGTAAKIIYLVENAGSKKAKSEKFITKFARYYTPIVVGIALLVAVVPPVFGFGSFSDWIYKAIIFLVISCPCALVISIPLSFFGGIGSAANHGILIKGGNYLESLYHARTVVFDKTGTLTKGILTVSEIFPADGVSKEKLIELAAIAESHSTHPIGRAILDYHGDSIERQVEVSEKAGFGVISKIDEGVIHAGNKRMMDELGVAVFDNESANTAVYIAFNDKYMGKILVADELKPNAKENIRKIREGGINEIVMLTGDNSIAARDVAGTLAIDSYKSDLLPQHKVQELESIIARNDGRTVFVGDGINDAPVLARADIGIAMGGIGSDAAIEAADVVIMNDDIGKISTALKIAKKTRGIVVENIILALGIKILIMILALFGMANIWEAIFADVGVALLALFNALRAMRIK